MAEVKAQVRPAMVCLLLFLAACGTAPVRQPASAGAPAGSPVRAGPNRVVIAIGAEVNGLATKMESGNTFSSEFHFMVNSPLTLRNPQGVASPLLAAELPSRDAGTWIVNADGTMRTTWKIRSNARWHDGQPLTTRDFVFAFEVYTDERLPVRDREPEQFMEPVDPHDDKTIVIHWKRAYPWANELGSRQLEALPDHILRRIYEGSDPEAFLNHAFWSSTAYVGDGPFRLLQWDPGTQLVFRAFDEYFMGRPGLDEVIFRVISDTNTVVASVLGGTVDATVGITLGQRAGATVTQQWSQTGEGKVLVTPVRFRYVQIQFDPARSQQPALLDLGVRRAIVQGIDRNTMAEIVTEGTSQATEVPVSPYDSIYPAVQQAIVKYPYDPARSAALLQEAGWTRRGDLLAGASGQPFGLEVRTTAASDNEAEQNIMAADLTRLGMQIVQTVIPQSRIRDSEYRVTFPGLNNTAQSIDVPGTLAVAISDQCASVERRYQGSNRGCWKHADFDRMYLTATTSLDPMERTDAIVQAMRVLTEEVGIFGLSYNSENIAIRKGLVGPGPRWPAQVGNTWNIHEWHWTQ